MKNSIYSPEEDSFLMSEYISKILPKLILKNKNIKFLEVGSGSGINLKTALESGLKKQNILSCDVNKDAVLHCNSLGFNCIKSDLFKEIKGKYDIIIFNPPYLPEDENYLEPEDSKLITTGGKEGNELIIKFLKQAKPHIDKSGIIFIITSSLSKKINFNFLGYKAVKVSIKKLFFEKLYLWKLVLNKK